MKKEINIGDEFITKSRGDANGGYVMTILQVLKDKKDSHNDTIEVLTRDLKRTKSGQAKLVEHIFSAKRWWINEWCKKIKR